MSRFHFCPTGDSSYTHVVTDGDPHNPPIFFSSGLGSHWFDWHDLIYYLSENFYCVCINRPGYGKTPSWSRSNPPTVYSEVQRIHQVKKYLAIEQPIHLVSHSMGNFYAEGFTLTYPHEVATVTHIDPSVPDFVRDFGLPSGFYFARSTLVFYLLAALRLTQWAPFLVWKKLYNISPPKPLSYLRLHRVRQYVNTNRYVHSVLIENTSYEFSAHTLQNMWRKLGETYQAPTFIISARQVKKKKTRKENIKFNFHRAYAVKLQAHRIEISPSCHTVMYDQPEKLANLITSFIQRNTSKS